MAALTAAKLRQERDGVKELVQVTLLTGTTFYPGAICSYNAAGKVVPATDTSGERVAGIFPGPETLVTTADTEGTLEWGHIEWIAEDGNLSLADNGDLAIVLDDGTATNAATATNDVPIGEIVGVETFRGQSGVFVRIGRGIGRANA